MARGEPSEGAAFNKATAGDLLEGVSAIGVAGQQHDLVALDDSGRVVRPALLWNDVRSAKLRWLAEHEPENAERVAQAVLPHDRLTAFLGGGRLHPAGVCTDRGDASGAGYWSPASGSYRSDLAPGDVVVSLGTSGTAFGSHHSPSADATGVVASFANATGGFLPLVCTLNAARVLTSTLRCWAPIFRDWTRWRCRRRPARVGRCSCPASTGANSDLPTATGAFSQ